MVYIKIMGLIYSCLPNPSLFVVPKWQKKILHYAQLASSWRVTEWMPTGYSPLIQTQLVPSFILVQYIASSQFCLKFKLEALLTLGKPGDCCSGFLNTTKSSAMNKPQKSYTIRFPALNYNTCPGESFQWK